MKKALSLILALVLCLSLCACGGNSERQPKNLVGEWVMSDMESNGFSLLSSGTVIFTNSLEHAATEGIQYFNGTWEVEDEYLIITEDNSKSEVYKIINNNTVERNGVTYVKAKIGSR